MQIQVWHINPASGLHLGRHGLGQETSRLHIPSDTLFSAFIARLSLLAGESAIERWLQYLLVETPAFVLTSAFPRAGKVCFFPLPAGSFNQLSGGEAAPALKELKKIRYVSEALFRRLLTGEPLGDLYRIAKQLQGGVLLYDPQEAAALPERLQQQGNASLWQMESRPRVTIDRITNRSNLLHTGRTTFADGCGLWFGLRWLSGRAEIEPQFRLRCQDLGDSGLGGERSAGFGAGQVLEAGQIELPDPKEASWVSLSRYLPREDELGALQYPGAAYQIEPVGGWVESFSGPAQRRRTVNMLSEGALLGPIVRTVPGQLARVEPRYPSDDGEIVPLDHPVYRAGLAFAVGKSGRRQA